MTEMIKTNVMRILEQHDIPYTPHTYPHGKDAVDAITVAQMNNRDVDCIYKTLLSRGKSGDCFVFVIPAYSELDLKKAARAVHEKAIEMLPLKELLPTTGYVRGGCSPVGMKKPFVTVFHELAEISPYIIVSAGKIGYQIECNPDELCAFVGATYADVTVD